MKQGGEKGEEKKSGANALVKKKEQYAQQRERESTHAVVCVKHLKRNKDGGGGQRILRTSVITACRNNDNEALDVRLPFCSTGVLCLLEQRNEKRALMIMALWCGGKGEKKAPLHTPRTAAEIARVRVYEGLAKGERTRDAIPAHALFDPQHHETGLSVDPSASKHHKDGISLCAYSCFFIYIVQFFFLM
jgi:hypothetical protein